MSSETLHKVLREKLISTVKPGGGTLLRTYHNLHRSGNVGENPPPPSFLSSSLPRSSLLRIPSLSFRAPPTVSATLRP